jgi:hypothetical protein
MTPEEISYQHQVRHVSLIKISQSVILIYYVIYQNYQNTFENIIPT